MPSSELIALYELKRQGILLGFVQHPDRFDPALAFAYQNRLAPIFHSDREREVYEEDPFKDVYAVKADFVNEVIKYIDEKWLSKELDDVAFYKLEDRFGGYHANRVELIHVIEYARISRRFDDELYAAIEADAPLEANSLESSFTPDDVYFH